MFPMNCRQICNDDFCYDHRLKNICITLTSQFTILSGSTLDNLIIGLQFGKGFSHLRVSSKILYEIVSLQI